MGVIDIYINSGMPSLLIELLFEVQEDFKVGGTVDADVVGKATLRAERAAATAKRTARPACDTGGGTARAVVVCGCASWRVRQRCCTAPKA